MSKKYTTLTQHLKELIGQNNNLVPFLRETIENKDFVSAKLLITTNLEKLIECVRGKTDAGLGLISYMVKYDEMLDCLFYLVKPENINLIYGDSTLLGIAANNGAKQTVISLMQNGANPKIRNIHGETPIFLAVGRERIEIVKYIVEHSSIDLNIPDSQGRTPLHIAALVGNHTIGEYLISKGANPNIPYNNSYRYFDLLQLSKQNMIKLQLPPLENNVFAPQALYFQVGNNKLYQVVFEQDINPEKEKTLISEARDNLKKFVEGAISQETKSANDIGMAQNCLVSLIGIYFEYGIAKGRKLEEFITTNLEVLGLYDNLVQFYEKSFLLANLAMDLEICSKYASLALNIVEKNYSKVSDELKFRTYYNMGGAFFGRIDINKAIEYQEKAISLAMNREIADEAIIEKIKLVTSKNVKNNQMRSKESQKIVEKEAERIVDKDLRDLVLTQIYLKRNDDVTIEDIRNKYNFNRFTEEELIASGSRKKIMLFDKLMQDLLLMEGKYDEVINYQEHFQSGGYISDIPAYLNNKLMIFQRAEKWKEGLEIIEEFYKKFPKVMNEHNIILLKFHEFIFYEANGIFGKSDEMLDILIEASRQEEYVYDLALKSLSFGLYIASVYNPTNNVNFDRVNFYFAKANSLKQTEELRNELSEVSSAIEELKDNYVKTGKYRLDEHSEQAKGYHEYFQQRKYEILQTLVDELDKEAPYSWETDKGFYRVGSEKVVKVFEGEEGDIYSVIEQNFAGVLEVTELQQFNNALRNGMALRSEGVNGIKYIKDKLYELKINENARLVATEIYRNDEGQSLIIFDRKCNHAEIKKLTQEKILKVIECKSCADPENNIEFLAQAISSIQLEDPALLGKVNEELES